MASTVPEAPFTDVGQLKEFLTTKVYSRDMDESMAAVSQFYKLESMEELLTLPAKTNSGKLGTFKSAWLDLFPFVDMNNQHVDVDDVTVSNDGYSFFFWGRWNGKCEGTFTVPSTGETIDLTGKSFKNVRYAYKMTFDRETKKAVLFEGLVDCSEWGRMMDSPEFAMAAAKTSLYPA